MRPRQPVGNYEGENLGLSPLGEPADARKALRARVREVWPLLQSVAVGLERQGASVDDAKRVVLGLVRQCTGASPEQAREAVERRWRGEVRLHKSRARAARLEVLARAFVIEVGYYTATHAARRGQGRGRPFAGKLAAFAGVPFAAPGGEGELADVVDLGDWSYAVAWREATAEERKTEGAARAKALAGPLARGLALALRSDETTRALARLARVERTDVQIVLRAAWGYSRGPTRAKACSVPPALLSRVGPIIKAFKVPPTTKGDALRLVTALVPPITVRGGGRDPRVSDFAAKLYSSMTKRGISTTPLPDVDEEVSARRNRDPERYTHTRIARILDVPPNTVRRLLSEAKRRRDSKP